ncbi:hypothetical protein [Brevundimonas sp.]|jgi:hypothetical protein|uniref:hypothetical protein n=1 Tax=Brevundimonas sp. TaxID=1871086 RepID=UPI002E137881|nr:hypothetical protein [Brevundimonas sp.]
MRKLLLLTGAALAVSAAPAAAQVLGGVGGNVSGNVGVGVSRPDLGVGQTVREGRQFGRDTVRSTRDALPGAEVGVDARGGTSISARPSRVSTQTDLAVGTEVRARDGDVIGSVVGTTRNARGYVQTVLIRTADGVVRSVPAASADVQADVGGSVMVSRWDRRRVERQRPVDDSSMGDRQREVQP